MKEDTDKTNKFIAELFDDENYIIDDTGIESWEDWIHLQWAAQHKAYDMMEDFFDIIEKHEIRALLGKTSVFIFKLEKNSIWKFKSGINEKKFEFKWIEV